MRALPFLGPSFSSCTGSGYVKSPLLPLVRYKLRRNVNSSWMHVNAFALTIALFILWRTFTFRFKYDTFDPKNSRGSTVRPSLTYLLTKSVFIKNKYADELEAQQV